MVSWEDLGRRVDRCGGQEDEGSEQLDGPAHAAPGPERRAGLGSRCQLRGPEHQTACSRQLQAQSAGLGWKVDANRLGPWGLWPQGEPPVFLPLTAHPMASTEVTVRG